MRLRTTAPPSACLMLKPKRLSGSWFARKKTVKWEFERRLPVRYTASNSPRRTIRASRGNSRAPGLLGREPMASLLAARRQYFAASDGLHAYPKSVRLRAPPFIRLICSLWQSNPPLVPIPVTAIIPCSYYAAREFVVSTAARLALSAQMDIRRQAASAAYSESISVVDPRARGQENCGAASYSPSNVKCTSFISVISVMTIARVPLRSNTIPVARTYLPTKGISFFR